jgi:hypothetical protein
MTVLDVLLRNLMVIGKQNGPTSANKMDPPGVKSILRGASPLATAALVCSCSSLVILLRLARRAKRKRALRGRNPPGIARPTVRQGCISLAPGPRRWPGGLLLPPLDTGVHASENPGGLGAEPPRLHPSVGLLLPGSLPFFFLFFIDSRKR